MNDSPLVDIHFQNAFTAGSTHNGYIMEWLPLKHRSIFCECNIKARVSCTSILFRILILQKHSRSNLNLRTITGGEELKCYCAGSKPQGWPSKNITWMSHYYSAIWKSRRHSTNHEPIRATMSLVLWEHHRVSVGISSLQFLLVSPGHFQTQRLTSWIRRLPGPFLSSKNHPLPKLQ